tara:strand:- start:4490 stop:5341 length:852 start_codon:yes stop_codon:yes gene_type:complete
VRKLEIETSVAKFQMAVSHLLLTLSNVMELLWDHTFGKQEHQDLVICRPMAIVEHDEEETALESGWLALDHPLNGKEVFYQSRSTRVNLDRYKPRFSKYEYEGKKIGYKIIDASEMVNLLSLPYIYKKYMKRKKFREDYDPFGHYHQRDQFMIFYLGTADNIVGFTKQKRYSYGEDHNIDIDDIDTMQCSGVESVLHANTIPISAETLDIEMTWAAESRIPYYYLGSGYEQSSEYKASWQGFQWWTGTEWSTNKSQYRRLCNRDSRLTDFSSLGKFSLTRNKT